MLEKVVSSQVTSYLQQHQLLDPMKSSYRKGALDRDCTPQARRLDMDAILDEKDSVLLVMLDLSAFHTIDHAILLNRLDDSMAKVWYFLTDRHQSVHINDAV